MRYYDIVITPQPKAGSTPTPAVGSVVNGIKVIASTTVVTPPNAVRHWTSFPNGVNDPGALNVEFDFFSFNQAESPGQSTITIHGVSLADLFQKTNFGPTTPGGIGMQISVKAGMQAGLPLANPKQAGTILQGSIFQVFGNWVGTEMTLDFVVVPSPHTLANPGNIVLNWKAGTPLDAALTTTLNVAYPSLPNKMAIGKQYVLSYSALHAVSTLRQLSQYVNSITNAIQPPGVHIVMQPDGTILAYDGSKPADKVAIAFTDLVGQPTWSDQNTIQIVTVLRADIQVGSIVTLPQGFGAPGTIQTTAASLPSQLKYQTSFPGSFIVQGIRQVGNFRDPNGGSWVTILTCATQQAYPAVNIVTGKLFQGGSGVFT